MICLFAFTHPLLKQLTFIPRVFIALIMGNGSKIEGGHDIFQTVRAKIKVYSGQINLRGFDERMDGLKQYLDELSAKIKTSKDNMDFSRYPLDQKYNPHF
jgi:hypothetical protein